VRAGLERMKSYLMNPGNRRKVRDNLTANGVAVDTSMLEHLDLTIHLLQGKLETDVFQKDIPIYISRTSCHPPATFSAGRSHQPPATSGHQQQPAVLPDAQGGGVHQASSLRGLNILARWGGGRLVLVINRLLRVVKYSGLFMDMM